MLPVCLLVDSGLTMEGMFGSYRRILSYPGTLNFSLAGVLTRIPMTMIVIAIVLMVSGLYGDYQLAGRVSAVNIIAYAVALPYLSRMIDKYGQARIMTFASSVSVVSLFVLAILAWNQAPAWQLYIAAAISGATEGNYGSLVRARWASVTDKPADLHSAFALESTFDELCFVLGPPIATFLTTGVHSTAGIWLAGFLTIIGASWFLLQRSTEPHPVDDPEDEATPSSKSVMRSGTMISLALVFVGTGSMFGAIDIVVVAFTEEQGIKSAAGIILSVFALGSLFGGLLYGAHTWTLSLLRRYIIGIVILGSGVSLLYFAHNIFLLAAMMFFTGFFIAPTMTNVTTMVQFTVKPTRLTEGFAWLSTALNIGVAIGANFGGQIVENHNAHTGFFFITMSAWSMAAIALLTLPLLRSSLAKARTRRVHRAIVNEELKKDGLL